MRRSGAMKESASLATAGSVPDLAGTVRKSQAITKRARNQLLEIWSAARSALNLSRRCRK